MTAPDRLSLEEIQSWPKAELHCHLDGSLRLQTVLDLATTQGKLNLLPSTSLDELGVVLARIDKSDSLESYLAWFRYTIPLMQSADALHRIAFELAEDNARENVRYLEVRYGPILHTEGGLSMEQVNDAVRSGLRAAEEQYDITTSIIVCGLRDRFESSSLMQAELAVRQRVNNVVAFDLAGGE
jgi:adenosine deaminase